MNEVIALSPAEAAKALGVSLPTMRRLLADGEIRSFCVRRSRRITTDALREYVAAMEAQAVPA